ncbi:tRNA lysidine(34) synthetase TilS [Peptoanaerobacter stomatis]|uniref:tRNA(Ile)-lysidine synthase n=1 Tax=Peptoanaerobacter stomatis TaxID=796937 RepID=G9XFP0_9FIRM|nr:tRNA lysidine(34) synthetase TilS [Peptoanaerobacter stomatis]EHL15783.1 hypothetical protein HMPREF9628_00706 [Peptoanaerobacter stomatis]
MLIYSVKETIERENLIKNGDKILVALSGGPDSICLLDILVKLREEYNLTIYAAHLNHRIRGVDAQKDALYCSEVCEKDGVIFFLKSEDVPALAKEKGKSIEDMARQVRYTMLFDIKQKLGIDKIAVAHNLDDQAETVLMKLLRGSGMQGLRGMDYIRDDGIIRPLLDIYKYDILQYCEENYLNPRIDKTNFEDEYTRNKIRLNLIPYLEKNYSSNIKQILSRTANIIREDYNFIENVAKENYELIKSYQDDNETVLDIELLKNIDKSIKRRIVRMAIISILKDLDNIETVHINDIIELMDKDNGKMLNLPRGLKVYVNYGKLTFTLKEKVIEEKKYSYKINLNGYTRVDELNLTVISNIISKQECLRYPTTKYAKAFDYSKIQGDLVIRNRENGDKINAIGLKGTKKIKDILIDKKIPAEERYMYPIFSDDNGILWLFGYRIAEDYKIDESTDKVVRIQLKYDVNRRDIIEKFI